MTKFFRQIRLSMINQNRTRKYLLYAIGEIILVVIGILIALQVNNWNESIKTKDSLDQTLVSLKNEIEVNQKQIKSVFEYHKMLRDTLRKINSTQRLKVNKERFGFWKGHKIFRLRNASFQTAVQSGAFKNMTIELSESLNNLYTSISVYNDFSQSINNNLYSVNQNSQEGIKQLFSLMGMIMEDIYFGESNLLKNFDQSLALIEDKLE